MGSEQNEWGEDEGEADECGEIGKRWRETQGAAVALEDGEGDADAEFPGAIGEEIKSLHGDDADVARGE